MSRNDSIRFVLLVACAFLMVERTAWAQLELDVGAKDDKPGPVSVLIEAKAFGVLLNSTTMTFAGNDNNYDVLEWSQMPIGTTTLRLTLVDGTCSDCANDAEDKSRGTALDDTDRDFFLLTLFVVRPPYNVIKGDEFDRGTCIGGSGANFSGNNNVGRCDVAGDWMEFDFFPFVPTLSEWGVVLLVMTLLTMGVVVVRRRLRVS